MTESDRPSRRLWPPWPRPPGARREPGTAIPSEPRGGKPFVRRGWFHLSLQFTETVGQSRMSRLRPDALVIDYTRTMMAALLFRPHPASIGMIGLGGGSQAKFCYRHLPDSRIEAVEVDPEVIALRRVFRIPDDDRRFRVVLADGAEFLRARRGQYDLLIVDGYDPGGLPASLSSPGFYADCRAALTANGVMTGNLYGPDADRHLALLRRAFGKRLLVLDEARASNRVLFAWVGEPFPAGGPDPESVLAALPRPARSPLRSALHRVAEAFRARDEGVPTP